MARGDSGALSDVDLLISEETGSIYSERTGRVEVQFTPQEHLLDMARRGDLFAAHLVCEAKVVSDPDDFFTILKKVFRAKKSYDVEIHRALSLAAYLRKRRVLDRQVPIRNKRVAWCVRTVLISQTHECGDFVFSPDRLAELYPDPNIKMLLSCRRMKTRPKNLRRSLSWFLEEFGGGRYLGMGLLELRKQFKDQNNEVALSTIRNLKKSRRMRDIYN